MVSSMVVAFDGPSKCGKTLFTEMVAEEARFQQRFYAGYELSDDFPRVEILRETLADWAASVSFQNISTISAGNVFRAAAYYVMEAEKAGRTVDSFAHADVRKLRNLLATDGVVDFLQEDEQVGRRVSSIAQFTGTQLLCGTIFCDFVVEAYERDGGSNLAIVDARDPIGHFKRNDILGDGPGKILPASVMPLYIDTPVETAASRMKGNLHDNIAIVQARRHADTTRPELPVRPPATLSDDLSSWLRALPRTREGYIPTHFLAKNDADVAIDNIQYLASVVAACSNHIGLALNGAFETQLS